MPLSAGPSQSRNKLLCAASRSPICSRSTPTHVEDNDQRTPHSPPPSRVPTTSLLAHHGHGNGQKARPSGQSHLHASNQPQFGIRISTNQLKIIGRCNFEDPEELAATPPFLLYATSPEIIDFFIRVFPICPPNPAPEVIQHMTWPVRISFVSAIIVRMRKTHLSASQRTCCTPMQVFPAFKKTGRVAAFVMLYQVTLNPTQHIFLQLSGCLSDKVSQLQTTSGGRIAHSAAVSIKMIGTRRKFIVSGTGEPSDIRHQPSVNELKLVLTITSIACTTSVADREEPVCALNKRPATLYDGPLSSGQISSFAQSQPETDTVTAKLDSVVQEEQDWEDLDGDDVDDPFMVAEYAVEIYQYLREIENNTLPNPNYVEHHKDIDWRKRVVLLDWMLQVHSIHCCLPETWFLSVNLIDRLLSTCPNVSLPKLQLLGLTCFFIATKFEGSILPRAKDLVQLAEGQYKVSELAKAEKHALNLLEWNLKFAGPMPFLRRGSKADDLDHYVRMIAKYLLEVASFDWRLVGVPTSMHAAAALYLGRMAMGKEEWSPTLAHYAGYTEQQILHVVNILINHLLLPKAEQSSTLVKKYASKKYMNCSSFMREWVMFVFPAGSPVDLEAELPRVKCSVRNQKIHLPCQDKSRWPRPSGRPDVQTRQDTGTCSSFK